MAPQAGLVSLKVLNDEGTTVESVLIDALHYVRERNSYGNELRIHGVNLSLGCDWIPGITQRARARYAESWTC